MGSITIRNLDDDLKERLRIRAAQNGHSMEEEVRHILRQVVGGTTGPQLLHLSRALFGPEHGVELELPPRSLATQRTVNAIVRDDVGGV